MTCHWVIRSEGVEIDAALERVLMDVQCGFLGRTFQLVFLEHQGDKDFVVWLEGASELSANFDGIRRALGPCVNQEDCEHHDGEQGTFLGGNHQL